MKHISQIISAVGTTASIVSLAFSDIMPDWLRWFFIILGLSSFAFLVVDEIRNNTNNQRVCKNKEEIAQAMKDIINSQGKICIMSRDLSWVTTDIAACLEDKKDSVLIFAQKKNERTEKLESKGVQVKYYGDLNFEPKTRFTIIRYNKNDPQVAIANVENSIRKNKSFKHVIYQTSSNGTAQDEWINSLAVDMVELCNAVCKESSNDPKNET